MAEQCKYEGCTQPAAVLPPRPIPYPRPIGAGLRDKEAATSPPRFGNYPSPIAPGLRRPSGPQRSSSSPPQRVRSPLSPQRVRSPPLLRVLSPPPYLRVQIPGAGEKKERDAPGRLRRFFKFRSESDKDKKGGTSSAGSSRSSTPVPSRRIYQEDDEDLYVPPSPSIPSIPSPLRPPSPLHRPTTPIHPSIREAIGSSLYVPNGFGGTIKLDFTDKLFAKAADHVIDQFPPLDLYPIHNLKGLWSGPTGLAYLFHHIAVSRPKALIQKKPASYWALEYLKGVRGEKPERPWDFEKDECGVTSERLCYPAVFAIITKDMAHVRDVVSAVQSLLKRENDFSDNYLYGRAGTLYVLRMIRHWFPAARFAVEGVIVQVTHQLLKRNGDWKWSGGKFTGALVGDTGIITQIVLTTPSCAPLLNQALFDVLEYQNFEGNWPSKVASMFGRDTVQFCHGAPGLVHSLRSIRDFFPRLYIKIDLSIERAMEFTWRYGLLKSEPNLCHGLFGNALIFPEGVQRDHFLALTTPKVMKDWKNRDRTLWMPSDCGRSIATLMSYAPSATWT